MRIPLLAAFLLAACGSAPSGLRSPAPPRAKTVAHALEAHGHVRNDEYYWLREREDPDVIAYLEAENEYTAALLEHTTALQEELYQEMVARVRQDDSTVPYELDGNWYYTRFEEGEQYPLHCRKRASLEAEEEVLLDVNAMAEGHEYFAVGPRAVSPSQRLIAYGADTRGRRFYTIEVLDTATGKVLERIPDVTANCVFAEDDGTLFYARQDPDTLRTYQVWRHLVGTDPGEDVLVFEEQDETFACHVAKSRSRRFLYIVSSHTLMTEVRILEADDPKGEFRVFLPRERDHEYWIDHHGESFYVLTNRAAKNFRLMRTPVDSTELASWEEVLPHRPDVLLEDFDLFEDHMVVSERRAGLVHLRVRPFAGDELEIELDDPAYTVEVGDNREFDTDVLRYEYSSLTTPDSVYDFDVRTRARTLRKRQEILGDFHPAEYSSERLHATARDGTQVPISLVYRLPFERDGSRPLLLYGYGSYGASSDAEFDPDMLSLLERGFAYAIAHVRGGQELGRAWYEDGKLLKKKNTFTDFIACGEHLVDEGYTSTDRLFAWGGSAGGLLMGAVVNESPELFHGVIAQVPFVDVVTTMLDASIPLTTFEYDEWGDPNVKAYYDYMLSYSPYDQVKRQAHPHMLVTTGLEDSQVQYWEPAKWVARLRALKTDDHVLLLKTDMSAGHGGVSGRYSRYRDQALLLAFLLHLVED